jgi:hypothetical protein
MEQIKKALREAFHAGNSYASMPEDDWKTCEDDFETWYGENQEVFKNLDLPHIAGRSEQFVCLANGSCHYEENEDIKDCKDCQYWEGNKAN